MSRLERYIANQLYDNDTDEISWYVWEAVDGVQEMVIKEGIVEEALDALKEQLPKFLTNEFTRKCQSEAFQTVRGGVDGKSVLLQI